jgi:xylan 1,4-beta-xylosidase
MEEQIVVDTQSVATPFPHIWEHMFGSCYTSMTHCEDWRNGLRALREIVDLKCVRFHGIFEHQVGIFGGQDAAGDLLL